jgi:hypothetical protein
MIVCAWATGTAVCGDWKSELWRAVYEIACVRLMQVEGSMERQVSYIPRRLRAREVLDIRGGRGLVVRCLAGALWITQDGDTDDIVVKAGQCFVLDRPGLALVSAPVAPATLVVERATRGPPCAAQRYAASGRFRRAA